MPPEEEDLHGMIYGDDGQIQQYSAYDPNQSGKKKSGVNDHGIANLNDIELDLEEDEGNNTELSHNKDVGKKK